MSRPTEILIDTAALTHNCKVAQQSSSHSQTVAVIKADAYGHGAVEIARALQGQVAMFAVSSIDEAMELRADGIQLPVLLLEGCFALEELSIASSQHFEVVMHNQKQLAQLASLQPSQRINVWLKIDTGMHRLGFPPSDVVSQIRQLAQYPCVERLVLMTHLSVADEPENPFTSHQLSTFVDIVEQVRGQWSGTFETSIANSAGILAWPATHANWDRPGIMLYGLSAFGFNHPLNKQLIPVMWFKSKVIAIRQVEKGQSVGYGNTWVAPRTSTVATVAVGYGDGYPRNAKSGTPVMVNGQRASLCGRVSMDMISVDVTGLGGIELDADVELWGQNLSADEVAMWANTIGYELVTRMPKRTPRRLYTD